MNIHLRRVLVGLVVTAGLAALIAVMVGVSYAIDYAPDYGSYAVGVLAFAAMVYFFGVVFEGGW